MTTTNTAHSRDAAAILERATAPDELTLDETERRLFSADIFHTGAPPVAIARPRNAKRLAHIVQAASSAAISIIPRGGGISYSAGYVHADSGALMIDMRAMNAIIATDTEAGTVTVEAGCTWAALEAHLKPMGLRARFWGTASGRDATIGGTLSQQAVLLGSGRHGTAGDNVVALKIVTADGTIIEATADTADTPSAFVGDCGALGIKAEATLPIMPLPADAAYSAFRFDDHAAAVEALRQTGLSGVASECFLFDRCWSDRRHNRAGQPAANASPGHRFTEGATFELHAAFEGNAKQVEHDRQTFDDICRHLSGWPDGEGVMRYFHAAPFGVPTLLYGPRGGRWIPMNFIMPHARHDAMIAAIEACIHDHRAIVEHHGIEWGWSALLIGRDHVLIEPSLYWADAQPEQVTAYFDAAFLNGKSTFTPAPEARAAVDALRRAMIAAGRIADARHIQIGRLYPADTAFTNWTLPEMQARKQRLDPMNRMNPGVLGL